LTGVRLTAAPAMGPAAQAPHTTQTSIEDRGQTDRFTILANRKAAFTADELN